MSSTIDNTIPPELLEAVLNDPDKRQLVLKLLNKTTTTTTQSSKKRKQQHFESPVALFRRRALEKLNTSDSSCGSTTDTDIQPPPGPQVPYEQLLEGVVAFVDVRRDNVDKSSGIKLVMESMGAVVKEKLAKGVTHVVFKDADYTTFYAARLLKCHLVSVLWLDAIRKKGYRVPEKNYPAFGGDDANASVLCSQIQKEFDDIIKEEKRRSYDGQTIQKEHLTLTTPLQSKSSYGTAKSTPQQSIGTDSEIVDILTNLPTNNFVEISTPDLTSDDSDCGVVNGYTSSHLKKKKLSCFETSSSFDTTKSTEPSQSLIRGFKRVVKSPGSSSTRSTRTTEQLQSLISGVKRPAKSPGGGSSSTSGRGARTNSLAKEGLDKESSDIAKTTPTDRSVNDTTTSVSTRSTNRRSSRSRSRTINILSDVIVQTPSTISDDNGTPNRSKKLKKSTINDESSDRTKTLSNTKISLSTNNRSSRKKSTINNESSDRTKTLSNPNISSSTNNRSSRKKSTINDESSDRTKTISTEKSMNISTNQSDSIMSPLRLSSGLNRNIDEDDDIPTTMSSLRLSSNSKNSNKENSELLANLNRVDVKEKDNEIDKIKEKQPKVIKRRRLFDPETVVCTPKNDDLEREERKRFLEAKDKHLETKHNIKLRNSSKGEKRKVDKSSDNTSSSSDEDSETPPKRQPTVRRCSQRLSITPRPISYKNNNNNNRRSSLEFQCSTETRKKIRTRIVPTKGSSIVCTRFHREEVVEFIKIVKKLGVFYVEQQVSKKTTHLIAGESKRTINMLRALAKGCWILKREWLDKSFEQGRWLPEEDYEFTEFSPAVQQCRLERQAFGPNYTIDIFVNCGKIYVSNNTTPGRDELRELIEICKGQLTNVYRNADIVIGQYVRSSDVICVNETWVLDSIQANKLRSVKKYLIKMPASPDY